MQTRLIRQEQRAELTDAHRGALDSICQETEALLGRLQREARQRLHQEIAHLQQKWEVEGSKLRTAEALHATAVEKLVAQHAAEAKEWEHALARHPSDAKLFKFSVRGLSGNPFCGSVPRSIFEADPDSALAHMYNGDWDYAKDEDGRAIVNSDPANWPLILNWLSFGTVPSNPSESLRSECRYWQLDKLLAAIDANDNSDICVTHTDTKGLDINRASVEGNYNFTVSGLVPDLPKRLSTAGSSGPFPCMPFTLAGRDWKLEFNHDNLTITS